MSDWTLFSNHGHVLVCLARDHEARLRSVASDVGITERAVQKIVKELRHAGIITITRHGRCNRYVINRRKNLRHPLESKCTVGRLLQLLSANEKSSVSAVAEHAADTSASVKKTENVPAAVTPEEKPQPSPQEKLKSKTRGAMATSPETGDASTESKIPPDSRQQGSLF